jgi:acyl-CoA thioesterase-1
MAKYMQPDGIHPSAEGVDLIVADMGPKVLELIERAR